MGIAHGARGAVPFRRMRALSVLATLVVLARPSFAFAQTPIVIDGTITDTMPRYFTVPFTVPPGTVEIEVRHDDLSANNILDWGLQDPNGYRGWGGGNTEPAVVNEMAASRSYLPGPIPPGEWAVMIGQAKIVDRPAHYHLEIDLRTTATLAPMTERHPYSPVAALSTGPRWYAGDFHVHSRESGDAHPTLDEIATYARAHGLDFVEVSDHNAISQLEFVDDAQARHPDLLFLPGFEWTTYAGHANGIGATRYVDFTIGTGMGVDITSRVDEIIAQGAVFSINHPVLDLGDLCTGCAWLLTVPADRVGGIEIQNLPYSETGALFYRRAIAFWETYLTRGAHVAPLGGSDDHNAGQDTGMLPARIGGPTTMVYATELSAAAILAAVRAGHTVVKLEGPDDPMVELAAGTAIIGDTVTARHVTLRATATHALGATLRFVRNGSGAGFDAIAVDADPFTTTLEVDAPYGDVDDRYRIELSVDGEPRVVTGHVWVRATGEPAPPDAGVTPDAGANTDAMGDGETTMPSRGCGCRIERASSTDVRMLRAFVLLVGLAIAMRSRRSR
jgi:hypothetical protein